MAAFFTPRRSDRGGSPAEPSSDLVQAACGYLAASAAVLLPLGMWFLHGLAAAVSLAQVVSLPLVVVSLGLAYWVSRKRSTSGRFRSARRRAHGWAVITVCFALSAVAISTGSTGLTGRVDAAPRGSVEGPAGPPSAPTEPDVDPVDAQPEHFRPPPSGDTAVRPQPDAEQPDAEQPNPEPPLAEQSTTDQPSTELPDTEEPETEQPGTEPPETEPTSGEQPPPEQPPPVLLTEYPVELSTEPGQESVEINDWKHAADKSGDLLMDQDGIYTARGAQLSLVEDSAEPSYDQCAGIQTWTDRVNFTDLHKGSKLCARSSTGRYATLRIHQVPATPDNDGRFIFFGKTWELIG